MRKAALAVGVGAIPLLQQTANTNQLGIVKAGFGWVGDLGGFAAVTGA